MGKLKNIGNALSRYQASKGFGVHSPFAFKFILNVLDEKYEYYAYDKLQQLRINVVERTRRENGYKPRVISISEAAAIFRIANYYNPQLFLSIGSSYGVAAASMLAVSKRSRMFLYDDNSAQNNAAAREILSGYGDRIVQGEDLQNTISGYITALGDNDMFVTVNNIADHDTATATALLDTAVSRRGVLIMRNIDSSRNMARLWQHCKQAMTYGMTFGNGKTAVMVLNPKLPRQDFEIWLS